MRKSIFLLSILILLTFVFIACAGAPDAAVTDEKPASEPAAAPSTPPPQPSSAPPPPAPPRVDISGLRDQLALIEKARKIAIDFESPAYFPSDWDAVESEYTAVKNIAADDKQLSELTESDVQEGKEWLNEILNTYNWLFGKTIPLYAQAREDEIMAVRDELINTGLAGYFPEYLRSADMKALAALDQYEAEDYYTARDSAVVAMDEYEVLLLGAIIYLTREELISTGLTYLYPKYLRSADEKAFAALDLYEADDYSAAMEAAVIALAEYEVLFTGARIIYKIEELLVTGLTRMYPEYLTYADNLAYDASDQYEAGDYNAAKNTAAAALGAYDDLLAAAMIYLRRQEILNRGFYVYDTDNFDNADEIALDAIDLYEAGNVTAAEVKAEEAMLRYNVLLTNGWISYAVDRRNFAAAEREIAINNRVNIAMRDAFREADTIYNTAEEFFKTERYDEAANAFTDAEALFAVAIYETSDRRKRAADAIRQAEEGIQGSMGAAIEAERIFEGGSR